MGDHRSKWSPLLTNLQIPIPGSIQAQAVLCPFFCLAADRALLCTCRPRPRMLLLLLCHPGPNYDVISFMISLTPHIRNKPRAPGTQVCRASDGQLPCMCAKTQSLRAENSRRTATGPPDVSQRRLQVSKQPVRVVGKVLEAGTFNMAQDGVRGEQLLAIFACDGVSLPKATESKAHGGGHSRF